MQKEKLSASYYLQIMIVFLVLISCTLIASADQTNDSDKYTFQNYGGEVYTPEPMEFGANLNDNFIPEYGIERKHVLIQFYDYPSDEQYEMLQNCGIDYLKSAAPYTLLASMPVDMTAADLPAESGLRWMGEIPVENKYDHIYGLDVPEWARQEDGNIQFSVEFYDDVSYQDALGILNQYSNNITNFSNTRATAYRIVTHENNITLIASEDSVMSLGYSYDDIIDETEFIDDEVIVEEYVVPESEHMNDSMPLDEQEDEAQETTENTSDPEEKETPGFTSSIGILIFALIGILLKRK